MRQQYIIAPAVLLALCGAAAGQTGGGYDLTWNRRRGLGGRLVRPDRDGGAA